MKLNEKKWVNNAMVVVVTAIVFVVVMRLWKIDPLIPLANSNGTDDYMYYTMAKSAMSGNGFYINSSLAAPFGQEMYTFPLLMRTFLFFCKFVGLFTDRWEIAVNLYYFLTYLLTSAAFYYLCRRLDIRNWFVCMAGALALSFSQYHLSRGTDHCTAAAYFVCVFAIILLVDLYQGVYEKKIKAGPVIRAVVFSVLLGATDIYYAFFACFLICYMIVASFLRKKRRTTVAAVSMLGIVVATFCACSWPTLWHMLSSGSIVKRSIWESYYYSFMPASLFLPSMKGTSLLSPLTSRYYSDASLPRGEMLFNYVGILGIVGVFACLWYLFFKRDDDERKTYVSKWILALILLGVTGGLGFCLAFFGLTQMRDYTRIFPSVYALLLLFMCFFFDELISKRKAWLAVLLLLFAVHMVDISPWSLLGDYEAITDSYNEYDALVSEMENYLDDGDTVLELPYLPGFENSVNGLGNLNMQFAGYLFETKDIGWSFGALANTNADVELRTRFKNTSAEQILYYAQELGYDGIYIDTKLFDESEKHLLEDIEAILGEPEVAGETKFFFSMKDKDDLPAVDDYLLRYASGFFAEETKGDNRWHWSTQNSELHVSNPFEARKAVLNINVNSYQESANLTVTVNGEKQEFAISNKAAVISVPVELQEGDNMITFFCDNMREKDDPVLRALSFCVNSVEVDAS